MEANATTGRSTRRRLVTLVLLLAVPLLLPLGMYGTLYYPIHVELDTEIERIRSQGFPIWFSDLALRPPLEGEDGTLQILDALDRITTPPEEFWDVYMADPPIRPRVHPIFRAALEANSEVINEITSLARQTEFRFTYDYQTQHPVSLLSPHIEGFSTVQILLNVDVMQSLAAKDYERVAERILDMIYVAELLQHEQLLVAQIVRRRYVDAALDQLETTHALSMLSSERFNTFDELLSQMESRFRMAHIVRAERAVMLTEVDSVASEETPDWASLLYVPRNMRAAHRSADV